MSAAIPRPRKWDKDDVRAVALYTAYLVEGADDAMRARQAKYKVEHPDDQDGWCNGPSFESHLDMAHRMFVLAMHINNSVLARGPDIEWTGVFEYEVVTMVGMWLAESDENWQVDDDAVMAHFELEFQRYLDQ